MGKPSIDSLPTQKSLIDLSGLPKNTFNSVLMGYDLVNVLDDILLVEFTDATHTGNEIIRNGIVVPVNADTNAWRIGRVIIAGPSCKLVKKNDYVCFPNNMGIPIANIEIKGHGTLRQGIFLNEQRIFGIVEPREENANQPIKPKVRAAK
jgi:hypothetical protein